MGLEDYFASPQARMVEPKGAGKMTDGDAEREVATDPTGPRVHSVLSGFPEGPQLLCLLPSISFSV